MLAYFHYCNKGNHPFSMDWTLSENIALAELDAEQVQFLKDTIRQVNEKGRLGALLSSSCRC